MSTPIPETPPAEMFRNPDDGFYYADETRTVWQIDPEAERETIPPTLVYLRDYTEAENVAADARAADAAAIAAKQAIADALAADAYTDNVRLKTAIDDLVVLLGDNTVEGSIRQWRAAVTNTYSVASQRNLADRLITALQAQRRVARATLRLSKMITGDTGSADIGAE